MYKGHLYLDIDKTWSSFLHQVSDEIELISPGLVLQLGQISFAVIQLLRGLE